MGSSAHLALAAVFASAVLHAAWNALLKRAPDQAATGVLISAGAAALTAVVALAAGAAWLPAGSWSFLVAAGVVEGFYFATLSQAMRRLPLGTAYGLSRGAGLLLIWPLSVPLFREALAPLTLAGAVLLSLGLFALVTRAESLAGLVMASLCAVTVALYPLAYKGALEHGVTPLPLFAVSLALSLPVQLALLGGRRAARLAAAARVRPWALGAAAALCAASFLFYLVALGANGPGRMTGLRNTSVLFVAAIGWLSGEPLTRRGLVSAVAIAAGAVLLSWHG